MNRDPSGQGPNTVRNLDLTSVLQARDRIFDGIEHAPSEGPFNPMLRSRELRIADENKAMVIQVQEVIDDFGWCLTVRDSELFYEAEDGSRTIKTVSYCLSDDEFYTGTKFTQFDKDGNEVEPDDQNTMSGVWERMYERANEIMHQTAGPQVIALLETTEARREELNSIMDTNPSDEVMAELEALNMEISTVHDMYAAGDPEYEALKEKFNEAYRFAAARMSDAPGLIELKAMESFMGMFE